MNRIVDIIDKLPHRGEYTQRSLGVVDKIIVHHSGSLMNKYTPYDFARWHIDPNGRIRGPRIAYHFCIEADGTIYQTNKLEAWSWHAGNSEYNRTSIGVELNGNFMNEQPTKQHLDSLKWLIKHLKKQAPNKLAVIGHKEVPGVSTGCPGTNLPLDKFRNVA